MKLAKPIKLSVWFFILFQVVVAYCCVWIFMRMIPAIDSIVHGNELSIKAAVNMTSILAKKEERAPRRERAIKRFEHFLRLAESSISEEGEREQIRLIRNHYQGAFAGDRGSYLVTLAAISKMADLNIKAMHESDLKAQRMSRAGAWGIVLVAALNFIAGLFFMHSLSHNLLTPLEDLGQTILDFKKGNSLRRCVVGERSGYLEKMMRDLNDVLDGNTH